MSDSSANKGDYRRQGFKVSSLLKSGSNCSQTRSYNSWSNLPAEVFEEIMKSLSLADQIRLRCVCKSFLDLSLCHDRPIHRLPWLVTYDTSESDGLVCKLFDPVHNEPYEILQITGPGNDSFYPDYVVSKHGWLLFLREIDRVTAELFLFCPFTKEIIVLPDLRHGFTETSPIDYCGERMRMATFSSSDPKSEDCEFFVVYYTYDSIHNGKITICSYRLNCKGWKTKTFYGVMNYIKITNLLYNQGNLFCMNTNGVLGTYNLGSQSWSLWNCWPTLASKHGRLHLVASEGMLLLAILDGFTPCEFFRLNYSSSERKLDFDCLEGLENQALFLGANPSDCALLIPALMGDLAFVGNKVFYRDVERDENWKFYDFNEAKHYVGKGTDSEWFYSSDHICNDTEFEGFIPREEEKRAEALWIEPPNHVLKRATRTNVQGSHHVKSNH